MMSYQRIRERMAGRKRVTRAGAWLWNFWAVASWAVVFGVLAWAIFLWRSGYRWEM